MLKEIYFLDHVMQSVEEKYWKLKGRSTFDSFLSTRKGNLVSK